MKTVLVIFAIVYGVCLIPSLRTAAAFWLYKDKDDVAHKAMRHGFLMGFISIWIIYPFYIIKDITTK